MGILNQGQPYANQQHAYPVATDIPLPLPRNRPRTDEFPFATMEVGHSFHVADETVRNAAMRAARAWMKAHAGVEFTSRRDKHMGGFRIWRQV